MFTNVISNRKRMRLQHVLYAIYVHRLQMQCTSPAAATLIEQILLKPTVSTLVRVQSVLAGADRSEQRFSIFCIFCCPFPSQGKLFLKKSSKMHIPTTTKPTTMTIGRSHLHRIVNFRRAIKFSNTHLTLYTTVSRLAFKLTHKCDKIKILIFLGSFTFLHVHIECHIHFLCVPDQEKANNDAC